MKPREERLEVVRQELAVEDEARLLEPEQRLDDLGEVARERALVAAPQVELVAVPEGEAAEAVPLGLVEVAVERQLACQPRQHRRDRRRDRHPETLPRSAVGQSTRIDREDETMSSLLGRHRLPVLAVRIAPPDRAGGNSTFRQDKRPLPKEA